MTRNAVVILSLAMCGALAGCFDIERRSVVGTLVGTDLAPLGGVDVRCAGDAFEEWEVMATTGPDGVYQCDVPVDSEGLWVYVSNDGSSAYLGPVRGTLAVLPRIALWQPRPVIASDSESVTITWSPAPNPDPSVYTTELQQLTSGWRGSARGGGELSSAEFPAHWFEDWDVRGSLLANHESSSSYDLSQSYSGFDIPHLPIVPVSRGAACEVDLSYWEHDEYTSTEHREVHSYSAGECPFTNGTIGRCLGDEIHELVIDLGRAADVGNIVTRSEAASYSLDGVTYTALPAQIDPLEAPVRLRFLRLERVGPCEESSAFSPR